MDDGESNWRTCVARRVDTPSGRSVSRCGPPLHVIAGVQVLLILAGQARSVGPYVAERKGVVRVRADRGLPLLHDALASAGVSAPPGRLQGNLPRRADQ